MSNEAKRKQTQGFASVFLLITTTTVLTLGGIFTLLSASSSHRAITLDAKSKHQSLSSNSFVLNILATKFRIIQRQVPIWYPVKYPSASEMIDATLPVIEVVQKIDPSVGNLVTVKKTLPLMDLIYDLDNSRMGSVLQPSLISAGKYQDAFISAVDVKKFKTADMNILFSQKDTSWMLNTANELLSEYNIDFMEYLPSETNQNVLKQIKVRVSDSKSKTSTLGLIEVDTPPTPNCKITASVRNTQVVRAGNKVMLIVKADSLTSEITVSTNDLHNSNIKVVPKSLADQKIKNLGTFTSVSEDIEVSISPGFSAQKLIVTAKVSGVDKVNVTSCTNEYVVGELPETEEPNGSIKNSCTIFQSRRGPGWGSYWWWNSTGDVKIPKQRYQTGGDNFNTTNSFYNAWSVWIPGRPDKEFVYRGYDNGSVFRYGTGYTYVGSFPPTLSGNYDPCNRDYLKCSAPASVAATSMPATYTLNGYTYQLMTDPSTGLSATYEKGGVCGSPDCKCWLSGVVSPLIIRMDNSKIKLKHGVWFNLGLGEKYYFWLKEEQKIAFLALDKNQDGLITDFNELFGAETKDKTGRRSVNGFNALAQYDDNDDLVIDKKDKIFKKLLLWFDRNANGKVEQKELTHLANAGIASISLKYKNVEDSVDNFGTVIRQRSNIILDNGESRFIDDIYFAEGNSIMVSR